MEIDIKTLDCSKIKVPEGYKVIIDPELIEKERRAKEKEELEARMKDAKEPSTEELAEFGKMYHPYYEDIRRLEELT